MKKEQLWRNGRILLALLALGMVVLLLSHIASTWVDPSLSDFYHRVWLAGRLLLEDGNPYKNPDFQLQYPLWTSVLTIPLALLPLHWAYVSWLLLSIVAIVASVEIISTVVKWPTSLGPKLLCVVAACVFGPTMSALLAGQLSPLVLLILCLATFAMLTRHDLEAGLVLGLTVVKPQLTFVVTPLFVLLGYYHRRWAFLIGTFLSVVALLILSWVVRPGWIEEWLPIVYSLTYEPPTNPVPSVWGLFRIIGIPNWRLWAVSVTAIVITLVSWIWWLARRNIGQLPLLVSVALLATPLVAPKIWRYDLTLLLMPWMYSLAWFSRNLNMPRGLIRLIQVTLFMWVIALPYLILKQISIPLSSPLPSLLLPLSLIPCFGIMFRYDLQHGGVVQGKTMTQSTKRG